MSVLFSIIFSKFFWNERYDFERSPLDIGRCNETASRYINKKARKHKFTGPIDRFSGNYNGLTQIFLKLIGSLASP